MLDRRESGGPGTRVEAVMAAIRARIDGRRLAPGTRLPSVRETAATMALSKSTVVEAYDRLAAEGAIAARRGAGFFVAGHTRPLSLQSLGPDLDRTIDPLWVTRQSMLSGPDVLKPGWGWLPSSWLPDDGLQKGLRFLAREPEAEHRTRYDSPLGFAPLREHLVLRLADRGIAAEPERIMLTDSASHGLDLVCRLLLEPGDGVLVDDPCYFNFHAMLRSHRAEVVGVPVQKDGPDIEAFAQALAARRPRLYITNAGLHNPTGTTLSAGKAHRVLKLAEAHDVVIVEDDAFADLESSPAPRLAAFGLDRVVLVGSYSKTVSAALRCGYVAGRADWIEALVDLKLATGLGSGHFAAALLHRLLTDGGYRRYLDGLRARLSDAMGRTRARLGALGIEPFVEPAAGMFVWGRLPGGVDAAEVARFALPRGVIVAPGNVFSASHSARGFMRFNVARCAEPQIFDVLAEALAAAAAPARAETGSACLRAARAE